MTVTTSWMYTSLFLSRFCSAIESVIFAIGEGPCANKWLFTENMFDCNGHILHILLGV